MREDRSWMYKQFLSDNSLNPDFSRGVEYFVTEALKHHATVSGRGTVDTIRCPCRECDNGRFLMGDEVRDHLLRKGFTLFYTCWHRHGEKRVAGRSNRVPVNEGLEEMNRMNEMVVDAAGPGFNWDREEEVPNDAAKKFYEMLEAADKPVWELEGQGMNMKCKESLLSYVSKLLNLKSEFQLPRECFDRMISIIKSGFPETENDKLPPNFYEAKKLTSALGLKYKKIDVCPNDCMLFYKDNISKEKCDKCGESRYKSERKKTGKPIARKVLRYLPLTPRLQRLYMSPATAEHMRWHKNGIRAKPGVMIHPADGEAWMSFDREHPEFAEEVRNVRLGLATDGFTPFNLSASPYSCWPVFIVPYNLPPGMAMKSENIFLVLVIPGPKSPGRDIDIFLEPLLDELKEHLWEKGVNTFDCYSKQNFTMRAALLWTINDFPAYGMLSGWSTHGRLACPICMGSTNAFRLRNGRKPSWFDHRKFLPIRHRFRRDKKHFKKDTRVDGSPPPRLTGEQMHREVRSLPDAKFGKSSKKREEFAGYGETHNWHKRSIFWRLPYWSSNLIRHNIDVMHLESNEFGNVFHTIMDTDKTKDNVKGRLDMAQWCHRPELELQRRGNGSWVKPKAEFCLTKEQKKKICKWLKELKFPDGYASNWSRCVNVEECKFYGLKSHDCHIFMERLLPVAFRDFLPDYIWEPLTELSNFFRDLCATELDASHLEELEKNIVLTLCKLEKIFPPGFFDSMEHLVLHVGYEARVGGPVQFRWMYPFERELRRLRKKVGNKAHPEGSIVEAYIIEEISNFCSIYFDSTVCTRLNQVPRHDDGGENPTAKDQVSVFAYPGRPIGKGTYRMIDNGEYDAAQLYVLQNCPEVQHYVKEYDEMVRSRQPRISEEDLDKVRGQELVSWFKKKVKCARTIDRKIKDIGLGPQRRVRCFGAYDVNGYRFHTEAYSVGKATVNSGICVKGVLPDGSELDYYGILEDVVELEYRGLHNKIVLFQCKWFDVTKGVKVDKDHGLVEVNYKSLLSNYEPFVFAVDAVQVYYLAYPSPRKERKNWWVASKVKAKTVPSFLLNEDAENSAPINSDFFQEDGPCCPFTIGAGDDIPETLNSEDVAEPLSTAEVDYIMQRMSLEGNENEMSESETESEYEREFDSMDYEEDANHENLTDSDSDSE